MALATLCLPLSITSLSANNVSTNVVSVGTKIKPSVLNVTLYSSTNTIIIMLVSNNVLSNTMLRLTLTSAKPVILVVTPVELVARVTA